MRLSKKRSVMGGLILVVLLLALGSLVSAQVRQQQVPQKGTIRDITSAPGKVFKGPLMWIGVSDLGNLLEMDSGLGYGVGLKTGGYEHLYAGGPAEGYMVAYAYGGSDHVAYDVYNDSLNIAPESFNILRATADYAEVEVVTWTTDNILIIRHLFQFWKKIDKVDITMTVVNHSNQTLKSVVLKRWADLDANTEGPDGWAGFTNWFNQSSDAVICYNLQSEAPTDKQAFMMVMGVPPCCCTAFVGAFVDYGNDYYQRPSPKDVATFPVQGDYTGTLHWFLGTLPPGEHKTVCMYYRVTLSRYP